MGQGVDGPGARQERERPVDGREAEPLAALPQARVEALRRDVVVFPNELGGDRDALAGGADADAAKNAFGPCPSFASRLCRR